MDTNTLQTIQGELERLFDLDAMKELSSEVLGFDPEEIGGTDTKGAFAKSLIGHCEGQQALHALVDAIMLSSRDADDGLRSALRGTANGELKPGAVVGALKVIKKIAEGGVSHVYLAELKDEDGGKPQRAALKVIRHEYARDRAAVHRFTTVSRVMQRLHAEGLPEILGVGRLDDSRPWVAASFVQGQTLAERVGRTGCLHMNEARPVFEGVLGGLKALHDRGIVHGDVKAENVYIVRHDGSRDTTGMLVDAGVERLLTRIESKASSTGLLPVLGTAKAVAPEQARGSEPDARSDIYAFGTMMYEVLAGKPAFEGDSAIDVIAQHLSAMPEPPSQFARKGWVSEALDELVLKALAKDPDDRFQSIDELLEALDSAARKPTQTKALDEAKFSEARAALISDPTSADQADALEKMGRDSNAWERAADAFMESAEGADHDTKLTLLFRAARIHETETREPLRAESAYQQVLEIEEDNDLALRGVETARRAAGDHAGVVEVLLERIEAAESIEGRRDMLMDAATIYEENLGEIDNAFVASLQALATDPQSETSRLAVERLASGAEGRWTEALDAMTGAVQQTMEALQADEQEELAGAQAQLAQAEATLAQYKTHFDGILSQRNEELSTQRTAAAQGDAALQQELDVAQEVLDEVATRAEQAQEAFVAADAEVEKCTEADEAARLGAEQKVDAYETLEDEAGEEPSEEQLEQLETLAGEAEALVDAAGTAEAALEAATQALEQARTQEAALHAELEPLQARVDAAVAARPDADEDEVGDAELQAALTDEEQGQMSAAEQQLADASELVEAMMSLDAGDVAEQRAADTREAVALYNIMGAWYAERLGRRDFALPCFSQALALEPSNEAAYDGVIDLYRETQAWPELSGALLQRAETATNPVKGREYRAQAAVIILRKLNDPETAAIHFDAVLAEDPANPAAQEALAEVLTQRKDWPALVELLGKRLGGQEPEERVATLILMAELNEDQLHDVERAQVLYEQAIELEPSNLAALKGLERLYARNDNFGALLKNLRTQVDVAATPKQRIGLLERVGLMQEEEFVDHAAAAITFEEIVAIDSAHDASNTALARLYRQMSRFEDVVETLDRHAATVEDDARKVELLLQAVRVLTVDIGSPDRAIEMCERVLAIDEEHTEALAEIARLKSTAGDTQAAVDAVERLAEGEDDNKKQADLWIRAAKMLDDAGDRDGAINRYKRALDVDKHAGDAAIALREIYAKRGDAYGAVEMLQQAIDITEGDNKRAALYAELGTAYRERLDDPKEALDAFTKAIELDAANTEAAVGLAAIAYENADYMLASEHYDAVMGRLDDMPSESAARVCGLAGAAFTKVEQTDKALSAFKRASELASEDLDAVEQYAAALLGADQHQEAESTYERAIKRFGDDCELSERVRLLIGLGKSQLAGKRGRQAVETAKQVVDLKPDDDDALDLLTRAYEATRKWDEVINLLQQRARHADNEDARCDLLVRTGDIFLGQIRDRDAAAQTYVMALDVKPDSRNILTKLMGVYSDAQDWTHLIEIILRIADMVDDAAQLSKYFNTAATIAHHELGRFDEAANYYEAALSHLSPEKGEAQFAGLVQCLTQNQDWERLERAYESRVDRLQASGAEVKEIATLLDSHAEVVRDRQGRLADALRLFEQAQSMDPDNRDRRAMLTAIYTKEPKRFFKRAVASHRAFLVEDPYRIESMQSLRKIYTSGKKPDESWCICQALRCLKMADLEEEKFFKKYRLTRLAKAKHPLDEELWRETVVHPLQDPGLTGIFSALTPAVIAAQTQPLESFGLGPQNRTDPAHDTTAMGRMLSHVGDSIAMNLPDVYHCPQDSGGLSFLFTAPPAIGIGQGAAAGGPQQALAFVAARHLSYYRHGHFLRHLVPTGTGLRAWLMAAIRTVSPKFAVPPTMEAQVKEASAAIAKGLTGPQRDALRSMTQKLLEAAPELDMKRWMAGIDLTADRVGLVLSNDLKIAHAVIEASPEDSSTVGRKERVKELLSYSISEPYFDLRKRMGIALGR